jgi:TonB-dependent starch-binding outer membrane protein SusC
MQLIKHISYFIFTNKSLCMNLLFRLLVVVMLLFSADALLAQSRRVTGTITDANGPVTGASVLIKGTTKGVATDIDGNFALDVEGADPILVISGVGYTAQEVAVGTQSAIALILEEDVTVFSDVVVTGYSVETKRETTGAVSTIKAKDLKAIPSGNVEQQLQGRVSGVTVISNGQPGTSSIIRVRGFNAFGGNEPLYIVDGVPVESTDFLAPDDIESTTVLKDAASASIYGARAANGVIVYTTKKGTKKAKALEVSYDGLYGSTDPGTGQSMLNPTEFAQWTWNSIKNTAAADGKAPTYNHPQFGTGATPVLPDYINVGGKAGVIGTVDETGEKAKYNIIPAAGGIYQVVRANKEGTDWYKAITRTAPLQRHNLGFSGGSESSRFYVGMGIQQQAGILIYNEFNRYDFRANAEFDVLKNLRVGQNLQFTYRSVLGQTDASGNGGRGISQDENDILQAFRMPSIIPVYDVYGGYAGTAAKGFNNPRNPVASRDGQANDRNFNGNGFGNVYAELDVVPGLTLRSSIGGQYNNFYGQGYSRLQYENSENNASFSFNESSGYRFSWVFTNTANYKKTFGVHGIDALVGIEALNTGAGRFISGSGLNPFSTDVNYVNLNTVAGAGKNVGSNLFSGVNFYSQFGKLTYAFNDKYYVTGVLRQDASSRFGANSRVGIFPAVSAAWRVTGEDFLKGNSIITDLKIRGGWGQMGNSNNVDPNNQYSLFTASIANGSYDINGSNNAVAGGFYRNRIGNADAKWETSTTTNVGLDGTLFGGKLDVVFDVWKKTTTDLLYAVPLPAVVGNGAAAPAVNIANMLNTGVDVQLINRGNITGDLKYEVTVNGGWLHNEITSLAPGITYFDGPTYRGITPVRNQVGQSISSFFGYNVLGYFKDKAEVDGAPKQADAAPGRFRYEDNNGTSADGKLTGQPDGKIDAADRTFIGSPVPKFTGGLYLSLNYKGFELGTYVYGSYGNKIYNFSKWYTDFYPSFSGAAISERVKNSWTPSNLNAETPIFEGASNFSTNTQSVSWYVEDGSYLRMQNLLVGYTLPTSMLKVAGIKKVRITASTNNLFTFTKYKGLDPSVGGAVDTNFGIDIGNYPLTRSYNIGVNLGF